jgi:hypothetical protein
MPKQSPLTATWQSRLDFVQGRVAEYRQRIDSAPPGTSHYRLDSLRREMEQWRKKAQVLQQKIDSHDR